VLARGGAPIRVLTSGEMLVPDREFLRSEFYNDYGRPLGLRYVLGTVVPLGEAGMMPIGLHRPEGDPPFGERERKLMEGALPHLRRAVQLRHRLKTAAAAAGVAALDAMPFGVLVLDATMRVLVANGAAEALAAMPGAGLCLQRRRQAGGMGSCVTAVARFQTEDLRLGALVREVALAGGAGGALRLTAGDLSQRIAALVMPLPRRLAEASGGHGGAGRMAGQAMVLLRDLAPAAPTLRTEMLRDLFGLTRTEAEVARMLVGGTSTLAVATQRGLKQTTVRSQVRSLLGKTGTANLRDLERLLNGLQGL
jgi:DNA-binding CsgD family transcriptional regulator